MLPLLWIAIVCGIVSYVANASPISPFFKTVIFAILAFILLAAFFQLVLGVNTGLPLGTSVR